jgi:hypothetical protein
VKLLAGRFFVDQDNHKDSEPVAIVNETFAKRFWSGESSLDKRVRRPRSADWIRAVGVTADVIQARPDEPPWLTVYLPAAPETGEVLFGMFGIVRTSGDPLSLMASVRELVWAADPGVPAFQDIATMAQHR